MSNVRLALIRNRHYSRLRNSNTLSPQSTAILRATRMIKLKSNWLLAVALLVTTLADAEGRLLPAREATNSRHLLNSGGLPDYPGSWLMVGWGDNEFKQAGPYEYSYFDEVVAGWYHTCARSRSTVKCWGLNADGQTTIPAELAKANITTIAAGGNSSFAVVDNVIYAWGAALPDVTFPLTVEKGVKAISAGTAHLLVLTQNSTVLGYGDNSTGQLSIPGPVYGDFRDEAVEVAAGYDHSLIRYYGGSVACIGGSEPQNCVQPAMPNAVNAIAAGDGFSVVINGDSIITWGNFKYSAPPIANASKIAAGHDHILAIVNGSKVVAWGSNDFNQTKLPPFGLDFGAVAVAAGALHSVALAPDYSA